MAKLALLVGISNYIDLNKLSACDNDVSDLRTVLIGTPEYGWSDDSIVVMTSEDGGSLYPTRSNLLRQFTRLCRGASPDDTILFFFSGHGDHVGEERYLCPIDADPDDATTYLSLARVKKELSDSQARIKLILMDACHSGDPTGRVKGPMAHLNGEQLAKELAQIRGTAVLASCRDDEVSWIPRGWRNSLWAKVLIDALRKPESLLRDGLLVLTDLHNHVRQQVKEYSAKTQTIVNPFRHPSCIT